ncbi:hypothetical protein J7T55_009750 [Diaporthe amygdali]|uniref:uncharacterized protein n=1 Tax=Phomopsis amygdali TaxID=1214568 RepID=UPI0022FE565B|nr:uncharacterized protein J7T55_009750 [Diaporthe amygdali]KAJ0116600.1 hypothetical protein J7T55_009750 [Diaporthe amygdali]
MEAGHIRHKPDRNEMQRINVDQENAGQDEVETATSPTSERFFRFLDLPPEIRNIVYSYSTVYRAEADHLRVSKCLPNLRQPPITRVNRQIRNECLAIFYEMHHFSLNLNVRFEKLAGGGYKIIPAAEGQASLQSFHEMIQAFAPSPKNTLQMSNLRFLPSLTVQINVIRHDIGLGCLGFHMSSTDETTIASLAVRGLDWNCHGSVKGA